LRACAVPETPHGDASADASPANAQELFDVAHHEWELLDRGDDDAGPLACERLGELFGALVDLLDDAVGVLVLADRLLQLPVTSCRFRCLLRVP
jgi:hypothetical protein